MNLSDAGPDTLRALGRLRAVVIARDRLRPGSALVTPWSVAIEWEGRTTECRFDSVSWAGDMVEAEYVYDVGRVTGGRGIVLWAPPGFRPRVLRGDAPLAEEAGTIAIAPGDPPRTLRIRARDVAGNETSRRVVLLPGAAPAAAGPGWARAEPRWTGRSLEFTSLPGGFVRLSLATRRAPAGASFQVGDRAARGSRCADDWCATLALPESAALATVPLRIAWREKDDGGTAAGAAGFVLARRAGRGAEFTIEDVAWGARIDVPGGALFEDGALFAFGEDAGTAADLEPVGASWRIEPSNLPLRTPLTVRLRAPAGIALDRTGLYRYDGNGWAYVGSSVDSAAREVSAPSRSLGRFAIFRDTIPPRIAWIAPPQPSPAAKRGPYSRWAVEAMVTERGSGVDARASWLEVDGARVPTEWDPEAKRLRWRPANPPAPGAHQVVVVAADRAGNVAREAGRFRIQP